MEGQPVITVMIVTNQPIMREGLRLRVEQEPDMQVVCEATDLAQTLNGYRRWCPDVAVIDLQSPQGAVQRVMKGIRGLSASTPLVVLAEYPEEIDAQPRTAQGSTLVVSKAYASTEVIPAIRKMAEPR